MQSRIRRAPMFAAAIALAVIASCARGEVKVEKVAYFNQPNCYRLSNGTAEVIVTTDIGPRIIRYALAGGDNMLAEIPNDVTKTEFGDWKPWGGHRLWHAPEDKPRSYVPDNAPIKFELVGSDAIRLISPVEQQTGIQKEVIVKLEPDGTGVVITHRLTNRGQWAIKFATWGLTIMHGGGMTILPQEPFKSHDDYVLPARPMVMWHYTNFGDPRWTVGQKYLVLRTDEKRDTAQKVGVMNKQGWAGYLLNKTLLVKRFPYVEGAEYPDYGCNNETFTKGTFMEVESLGAMQLVQPGQTIETPERWYLFPNVEIGATEATLDAAITPLIAKTVAP